MGLDDSEAHLPAQAGLKRRIMMSCQSKLRRTLRLACGLVIFSCLAAGGAAAVETYWLPADAELQSLSNGIDLYHSGLSGFIVGAAPSQAVAIAGRGGIPLEIGAEETLYAYLVEDAEAAAFAAPARVLHRSGHEVFVATPGAVPRLTETAAARLDGLKQPVLIRRTAKPWPTQDKSGVIPLREADPLIQQMVDDVTTADYMATWQDLEDFVTRYTYAPQNEQATQYILDAFQSFGLDAEFHTYQQSGTRRNVVATLPGTVDPTQIVYVTAHMDAISDTPESCAPGADDNGSGTAAVIEAARVLSQYMFEYTIKFVCFNGEEQGLVGSAAYVADIYQAGEDVIGAYNMDMIAYAGNDPAPPDLIIYTNSNSQSIAAALEDASETYVPGLIDPV
ncbi:MAG: M28 family peptidase, partial [Candidatus Eisenbacteria bacterium]|nr:M28 family peptidase [Candidatus Eisenbacteria bacterium]